MLHTDCIRSRKDTKVQCFVSLVCVLVGLMPGMAWSDGGAAKLSEGDGFVVFCSQWMMKLAERERANLAGLQFKAGPSGVVAEYVGYAKQPLSCKSRVERPGVRGVGVMIYHEIRYRREGSDRETAQASEPKVIERIEVTEVFRYDGTRWSY